MPEVSLESLDAFGWLTNILILAATIGVFAVLSIPTIRQSRLWRAVVTPLASIIGSGFLVVAPLLGYTAEVDRYEAYEDSITAIFGIPVESV